MRFAKPDDYRFLLVDPRPDLEGSRQWTRLLELVPTLTDKPRAEQLHTLLWIFRSFGAILIRETGMRLKLKADMHPSCSWDSPDEFESMKLRYLKPYATEIQSLFRRLDGYE